jgi:hypothetical protein
MTNATNQERKLSEARLAFNRITVQRDATISKLVRVHGKIKKLAASIGRYEKTVAEQKEAARQAKLAAKANNK